MMTLIETVYHPDGTTTIHDKGFGSKNEIIKVLKKQAPLDNHIMYELSKYNQVTFMHGDGLKRKLEIKNEALNRPE